MHIKHWDEWQLILLIALSNQMSRLEVMPAKSYLDISDTVLSI